jgi:hypothetical protein
MKHKKEIEVSPELKLWQDQVVQLEELAMRLEHEKKKLSLQIDELKSYAEAGWEMARRMSGLAVDEVRELIENGLETPLEPIEQHEPACSGKAQDRIV